MSSGPGQTLKERLQQQLSDMEKEELLAKQGENRAALTSAFTPQEGQKVSTAYDVARSIGSGLVKGVRSAPAAIGDAINLVDTAWQEGWGKVAELSGSLTPEQVEKLKKPMPGIEDRTLRGPFPTSAVTDKLGQAIAGPDYEPQTPAGRVSGTIAEMVPGAVSPGQAVTRGASTAQKVWRSAADLFKQAAVPGLAVGLTAEEIRDNPNLSEAQKQLLLTAVGGATAATTHSVLAEPRAGQPGTNIIPGQTEPLHPGTVERLGRDLQRSGGPDMVADEMHRIGPDAMTADASAAFRARAAAVAARNEQSLLDRIRERGGRAAPHITQTLNDAFGVRGDENFVERTNTLVEARRQQANEVYNDWRERAQGVRIATDPIMDAINENIAPAVRAPGSNTSPGVIDREMMNLNDMLRGRNDAESLHMAKLDLDQRIQAARAREGTGPLVRAMEQVRHALIGQLDQSVLNPDNTSVYGNARRLYAGDSAILDARERGRRLFKGDNSYTADHLELDMRDMSEAERLALVEGGRGNLASIMGGASNPDEGAGAAIRTLRSGENQRKLRLLEHPEGGMVPGSTDRINETLTGWARMQGTGQTVLGNSETARRQEALKDQPDPNAPTTPIAQRAPTWDQLVTGGVQKLGDLVRTQNATTKANRINDESSRFLTLGPGAPDIRQRLQALQDAYGRPPGGVPVALPAGLAGLVAGREQGRDIDRERREKEQLEQSFRMRKGPR